MSKPGPTATAVAAVTDEFRDTAVITPTIAAPAQPSLFASLVANADVAEGNTLERAKDNLINVPFVITSFTFRDGILRNKKPTNYVSVELVTADKVTLDGLIRRRRVQADVYTFIEPEESLVINDGSSGICRQAIAYLHAKGFITVPDGPNDGPVGECRWDIHRSMWIPGAAWPNGVDFDQTGPYHVRFYCPRGLRSSDYANPNGGIDEATTFYIG